MNEKNITLKKIKEERGIQLTCYTKEKPYRVQFRINGVKKHFGYYKTFAEAIEARNFFRNRPDEAPPRPLSGQKFD